MEFHAASVYGLPEPFLARLVIESFTEHQQGQEHGRMSQHPDEGIQRDAVDGAAESSNPEKQTP